MTDEFFKGLMTGITIFAILEIIVEMLSYHFDEVVELQDENRELRSMIAGKE